MESLCRTGGHAVIESARFPPRESNNSDHDKVESWGKTLASRKPILRYFGRMIFFTLVGSSAKRGWVLKGSTGWVCFLLFLQVPHWTLLLRIELVYHFVENDCFVLFMEKKYAVFSPQEVKPDLTNEFPMFEASPSWWKPNVESILAVARQDWVEENLLVTALPWAQERRVGAVLQAFSPTLTHRSDGNSAATTKLG